MDILTVKTPLWWSIVTLLFGGAGGGILTYLFMKPKEKFDTDVKKQEFYQEKTELIRDREQKFLDTLRIIHENNVSREILNNFSDAKNNYITSLNSIASLINNKLLPEDVIKNYYYDKFKDIVEKHLIQKSYLILQKKYAEIGENYTGSFKLDKYKMIYNIYFKYSDKNSFVEKQLIKIYSILSKDEKILGKIKK